ncbi:hypothetical protein R1sor_015511 [Riccia sorocarpa]|uniref:FCP1 homology domain-containing protein n=1 Tax=Riccia sorocarpa TaxID=122646 RepID=A0ABD3HFG6_9MARC
MVKRPERLRSGRPPARPPRGGRAAGRGRDAAAEEDDPRPAGRGDEGQDAAPVAPAAAAAAETAPAAAGGRPPRQVDPEGASLVPYQVTPDDELYLKWGWVRSEDIQPTVDAMDDQDIVSLNFVTLLGQDFQQPHVALSRHVVRDTFGLRYGMKPMDSKIRHERIQDWFPNRDVRGKRAEDDYDLTSFTVESLRTELVTVRKHLDATSHERYLETFIGMPLTAILIHAGVISPEETLTQPQPVPTRASSSQPPEELVQAVADLEARRANLEETLTRMSTIEDPRPRLVPPETVRGKVLILDLNGLLVRYCSQEEAAASRVFGHQPIHLSTHSCFAGLYDYNLATRDVLLVDDSVKKNSTNSPFIRFTPAWRQSTIPTPAYVRAHYRELGAHDPIEGLRSYWGDLVTPELSGLLFGDATLADRAIARSLFIGDVPAADVPVAVAGVDDPPVV